MANISLKIQNGDILIELSGESNEVKQIFKDIKENGLGYLSVSNKTSINSDIKELVDREDISESKEIKNVESKSKKIQASKKARTKVTITSTYEMLELNLSEEQRKKLKEYYSDFTLSTNVQRICVLSYWYKQNIGINEFDTNTIFTLLRMVQEKASFNIPQAFSDIQNRSQYLVSTGEKGKYKLTPIGEDYVTDDLMKKVK